MKTLGEEAGRSLPALRPAGAAAQRRLAPLRSGSSARGPSSPTGLIHGTPAVANLTRITVQGSTNKPREWLRLTIDPHSPDVFSWRNVVYCDDSTCPNP